MTYYGFNIPTFTSLGGAPPCDERRDRGMPFPTAGPGYRWMDPWSLGDDETPAGTMVVYGGLLETRYIHGEMDFLTW